MTVPRTLWRGEWYVYHHRRGEFLRGISGPRNPPPDDPDRPYVRWTPSIKLAKPYKNPSAAAKAAARINAHEGPPRGGSAKVATVVTVVTGEAARCLDMINKRGAPMTQPRYTVFDTERRVYLERISAPTGDSRAVVTDWTKRPDKAARFPGVKSAAAVVRMLGSYNQFVIKNAKGEVIG